MARAIEISGSVWEQCGSGMRVLHRAEQRSPITSGTALALSMHGCQKRSQLTEHTDYKSPVPLGRGAPQDCSRLMQPECSKRWQ